MGYHGYKYLFEIEDFVDEVRTTTLEGFIEERAHYSGFMQIRPLRLGNEYYDLINRWLDHYSPMSNYSTRVEVFFGVCRELGLLNPPLFQFNEPNDVAFVDGIRNFEVFNAVVDNVRMRTSSRAFKEQLRLQDKNAQHNEQRVLLMEEEMFKELGRWLVLSLTLNYQPRYRRWITVEDLQEHRDRFFGARRFNDLMTPIANYAWAFEQTEDGGLHMHVILFYSGEHNHDTFIAQQMGEYWVNQVTNGKGTYWNSNTSEGKRAYAQAGHGVGVGQINWFDCEMREALRVNLLYLAKSEQYLLAKGNERVRTFGMGKVPRRLAAGRPRRQRHE